mmetsp:Transcript_108774/g.198253  ORF Transcript_108774/g.198253 Transcript_108774/m.198253 type:complete len:205 (+) Transcript_108774:149-763(+)
MNSNAIGTAWPSDAHSGSTASSCCKPCGAGASGPCCKPARVCRGEAGAAARTGCPAGGGGGATAARAAAAGGAFAPGASPVGLLARGSSLRNFSIVVSAGCVNIRGCTSRREGPAKPFTPLVSFPAFDSMKIRSPTEKPIVLVTARTVEPALHFTISFVVCAFWTCDEGGASALPCCSCGGGRCSCVRTSTFSKAVLPASASSP